MNTPAAHVLMSISRAHVRASRAAMSITTSCIQMHGGIGFTDEHDIGLYLRKAMVVANQFGSAAGHAARYAPLRPLHRESWSVASRITKPTTMRSTTKTSASW